MSNIRNSAKQLDIFLDQEVWAQIPDYDGCYWVSNFDNVKRVNRTCKHRRGGVRLLPDKMLRTRINPDGYKMVSITHKTELHNLFIHRLKATAFNIPNPENKPYINHIDGNKLNNNLSNLEWVTKAENQQHAAKMGLLDSRIGEKNPSSRLKDEDVKLIRERLKEGIKPDILANEYSVSRSSVYAIKYRRTWIHI